MTAWKNVGQMDEAVDDDQSIEYAEIAASVQDDEVHGRGVQLSVNENGGRDSSRVRAVHIRMADFLALAAWVRAVERSGDPTP